MNLFTKPTVRANGKPGDLKPAYYDELQRMEKLKAAINEFPHVPEKCGSITGTTLMI